MDRELGGRGVTGTRSGQDAAGRDGGSSVSRPLTYAEQFEEACPYYMAMGMPYDEFWNGDCSAAAMYRKTYRLQKQMEDERAWLHGLYIYEAMCDVAPILRAFSKVKKPIEYPGEPHGIFKPAEKQKAAKDETQYDKMMARFTSIMAGVNKRFEEKVSANAGGDPGNTV